MRKTCFIINPASGNGQGLNIKERIEVLWKQADIEYETYVTESLSDIAVCVGKAINANATDIVVAGGDGTILSVANALIGSDIPVGIIPCGTGNDFVKSNGIDLDIEKAMKIALSKKTIRYIDHANCNETYFLNVASVGIDAAIVKRAQKVKRWLSGPLAYLAASLIEIYLYSPLEVTLTIDGISKRRTVELIAIANGCFYGGGMKIAPMADPSDGILDVVLINKMKKRRLIRLLPTLYSGLHIRESEVELFKGKSIQINHESIMSINLDGELISGESLSAEVQNHKFGIIATL